MKSTNRLPHILWALALLIVILCIGQGPYYRHKLSVKYPTTPTPNLQIVRHGPLEIEVRDVNIPPPGYGVATNGVGEFAMVIAGGLVVDMVTRTSRSDLLAYEWEQFDWCQKIEADIAAKEFHISEPPK